MNIEKMFDPNSYTEKAMPFITALNYVFEDCNHSELDRCSDAVMELRNKKNDDFSKVEIDLFNKVWDSVSDEMSLVSAEKFACGFKMGALLMLELLGNGGELK